VKYAEAKRLPQKPNEIRFVADSMLGSVARKLRIFGFDTLYVAHVEDSEVLKIGMDQDRVILTADKEFFKRIVKVNAKGVLVDGLDELEDLVHILEKNGIKSVAGEGEIQSRCSMCNGQLNAVNSKDVQSELPAKVTLNHKEFFRCIDCGKVYWEGSHIQRIRQLAQRIETSLGKNRSSH
jgi:uncharacterized protein with PIN domain